MSSSAPPAIDPGTSGFHCKGLIYLETLRYIDENSDRGRQGLLDLLPTDELRAFLMQPFVVGGWYDVLPIEALYRVGGQFMGVTYLELLRTITQWMMPRQIRTLYKFILALASPEMVMNNLPRAAKSFFDFVVTDVKQLGPKEYESSGANVPACVAHAYRVCTEVAVRLFLERAGAGGVKQRWLPNEDQGTQRGIPIVRVRRIVTWD